MEKHIITISREFGSGGRTIGKLVAEHLGIRCYDAELIQKLAAESGFDENYVKEAGEYTPGGFLASAFTDRSFGPTNSSLFQPLAAAVVVAVQVLLSAVTAKEKLPCKTKKTVDSLPPGRHSYGLGTAG
ncbi:MAG: AAA family ATPase [Subdoligranulum sp.]